MAVVAFGAVFLLGNTVGTGGGAGGSATTVVIAKQTIPLRHQITLSDLDTEKVSGNFTNVQNTYASTGDVVNLISEINISKGSVITSDMLARDANSVLSGAAPAYLPLASGYVGITIPTGEQIGVAGHISIGDYITVIASSNLSVLGGPTPLQGTVSKTVFTNVRVIGLGPAPSGVQSASGGASTASSSTTSGVTSSLTIELNQCDAEYMTWFLANMQVKYTIESFHDYLAQPPSAPDPTCPSVIAAQGVSGKQVDARYHFSQLLH